MRNLLIALAVVVLAVAPSLGVLNIKLTADNTNLFQGSTTTIRVWAQGTVAGVAAIGGTITASGQANSLTSSNLAFTPAFNPPAPFAAKVGLPGVNGGWGVLPSNGFGTMQTNYLDNDPNLGKADFVEIAHYTVVMLNSMGPVTLTFVPSTQGGFRPMETNKSLVIGTITPVTLVHDHPYYPGILELTPADGLVATGYKGGPFSPASQTYTLRNTGVGLLQWSITQVPAWLTVSRTEGIVYPGGTETVTVSFNSQADSLPAGQHSATLAFTNWYDGIGSTTRTVDLTVNYRIGDINRDGLVDVTDLMLLGAAWNTAIGDPGYQANCDLNNDDIVDVLDLLYLADDWGK